MLPGDTVYILSGLDILTAEAAAICQPAWWQTNRCAEVATARHGIHEERLCFPTLDGAKLALRNAAWLRRLELQREDQQIAAILARWGMGRPETVDPQAGSFDVRDYGPAAVRLNEETEIVHDGWLLAYALLGQRINETVLSLSEVSGVRYAVAALRLAKREQSIAAEAILVPEKT